MQIRFDIPQADRLQSVLHTVQAINDGYRDDISIANQVPHIEADRQGRYYRKAAEILGFVTTANNNSSLTSKGIALLSNLDLGNPLLRKAVLGLDIVQMLIQYLEVRDGVSKADIENHLLSLPNLNLAKETLKRRLLTLLSWLKSLDIIDDGNQLIKLAPNPIQSEVLDISDNIPGVFPSQGNLHVYQELKKHESSAASVIQLYKNQAKLERSMESHRRLVNLVASRITAAGGVPKANGYIDLATRLSSDYIFEMKSNTDLNVRSQIRKGISQLYEYRYIQKNPQAKLVLVLETKPGPLHEWFIRYIERDRKILVVWDGDDKLYATKHTCSKIQFMSLIPT